MSFGLGQSCASNCANAFVVRLVACRCSGLCPHLVQFTWIGTVRGSHGHVMLEYQVEYQVWDITVLFQ